MNKFLACGRDDTDAQDGLVEWEPVALTQPEYDRLVRDLKQRGHYVQLALSPHPTGVVPQVRRFELSTFWSWAKAKTGSRIYAAITFRNP